MAQQSASAIAPTHRKDRKHVLALDPDLGSIYVYGHCENIHVILGNTHIEMNLDGFQALAILIDRATANFELWAESSGRAK